MMCSTAREIMLSSLLSPPTTVLLKMYTSFLPYLEGTLSAHASAAASRCLSKSTNELLFQFSCLIDNPRFSYQFSCSLKIEF